MSTEQASLRQEITQAIYDSPAFTDGDPSFIADDVITAMIQMPLMDLLRGLADTVMAQRMRATSD